MNRPVHLRFIRKNYFLFNITDRYLVAFRCLNLNESLYLVLLIVVFYLNVSSFKPQTVNLILNHGK